jgi:hypothetical protein
VVSGGPRDRLESVGTACDARGTRVLHTAEGGAIRARITGDRLDVDFVKSIERG